MAIGVTGATGVDLSPMAAVMPGGRGRRLTNALQGWAGGHYFGTFQGIA